MVNYLFLIGSLFLVNIFSVILYSEECDVVIQSRIHLSYIANSGNNTISVCQLTDDGIITESCVHSSAGGLLNKPEKLVLNKKRNRIYISNMG